ncbi:EP400 protein, partial [Loxia curvirostra]|nr:EP400 protein [Loxia curvirostra]NXH05106.1 EP400 protein [Loxia leucoptera]
MPPVPQVAQRISQEKNQQQNGPNLSNLLNSFPAAHNRNPALPQQVQPAGWDKNHVLVVPAPVPSQQQENEILQQTAAVGKEGLWSLKLLPKLHEAPQHKSHHDLSFGRNAVDGNRFFSRKKMKDDNCQE